MRVKMSKQPPTHTYCERRRPLPYCIQIVGRPGTGSLPSIIAPPDHPRNGMDEIIYIPLAKFCFQSQGCYSYKEEFDPSESKSHETIIPTSSVQIVPSFKLYPFQEYANHDYNSVMYLL